MNSKTKQKKERRKKREKENKERQEYLQLTANQTLVLQRSPNQYPENEKNQSMREGESTFPDSIICCFALSIFSMVEWTLKPRQSENSRKQESVVTIPSGKVYSALPTASKVSGVILE
jgi:hypothetical protein